MNTSGNQNTSATNFETPLQVQIGPSVLQNPNYRFEPLNQGFRLYLEKCLEQTQIMFQDSGQKLENFRRIELAKVRTLEHLEAYKAKVERIDDGLASNGRKLYITSLKTRKLLEKYRNARGDYSPDPFVWMDEYVGLFNISISSLWDRPKKNSVDNYEPNNIELVESQQNNSNNTTRIHPSLPGTTLETRKELETQIARILQPQEINVPNQNEILYPSSSTGSAVTSETIDKNHDGNPEAYAVRCVQQDTSVGIAQPELVDASRVLTVGSDSSSSIPQASNLTIEIPISNITLPTATFNDTYDVTVNQIIASVTAALQEPELIQPQQPTSSGNCQKSSKRTFHEIGLSKNIIAGMICKGIREPREFQKMGLETILKRKDTMIEYGKSSGKTITAIISLLHLLDTKSMYPQAIVLTTSKKSTKKIQNQIAELGSLINSRNMSLCVDISSKRELREMTSLGHILVGTPTNFLRLMKSSSLNISNKFKSELIKTLVIDGIDNMLVCGFERHIYKIYHGLNGNTQIIILARYLTPTCLEFCGCVTIDAKKINEVEVTNENLPMKETTILTSPTSQVVPEISAFTIHEDLKQFYIEETSDEDKINILSHMKVTFGSSQLSYIFCEEAPEWLMFQLRRLGLPCQLLFGNDLNSMNESSDSQIFIVSGDKIPGYTSTLRRAKVVVNYNCPSTKEEYMDRLRLVGYTDENDDVDQANTHIMMITFTSPQDTAILNQVQTCYDMNIQSLLNS